MNGRMKLLYGLIIFALIAPLIAACTRTGMTPVPGGVGPLTIVMLLKNTLRAAEGRAAC